MNDNTPTSEHITTNLTANNDNIAMLKEHFGQCFAKNGSFDFDKFRQELTDSEVDFFKESYGLDWLGKSYARILATDEVSTLLTADDEHNSKANNANSNNLLLKGDNLEVLKHLSHAYHKQVKMIYIDPPYNTGSDGFVYADDRQFSVDQLMELAGVSVEKAQRILQFTRSGSNSHSAWLTFMYPRLYVARQLMRDDGVIFVSIDDNEVAQLRLLMDEIFGEENFLGELTWESSTQPINSGSAKFELQQKVEFILVYSKKQNCVNGFNLKKLDDDNFKYPHNGKHGKCRFEIIEKSDSGGYKRETMKFPILGQSPRDGKRWQIGEETANKLLAQGKIEIVDGIVKKAVYPEDEVDKRKYEPFWSHFNANEFGTAQTAKKELTEVMNTDVGFDTVKPTHLLKKLISLTTEYSDIVLDFFAGSATTADALMQLNIEDNKLRRFILVQIPEVISNSDSKSKTAYDFVYNELGITDPTIFDITKERIIRSANKITHDNAESKEPKDLSNQDLGFKIFTTMPIWDNYQIQAEQFSDQIELFNEKQLTENDVQALLTTWKTYDSYPLTKNAITYNLDDYRAFLVDDQQSQKLYLMNIGFTTKHLIALLNAVEEDDSFNPNAVIAFGYHFESKALLELNESLKTLDNKKNIDIEFVVRY